MSKADEAYDFMLQAPKGSEEHKAFSDALWRFDQASKIGTRDVKNYAKHRREGTKNWEKGMKLRSLRLRLSD